VTPLRHLSRRRTQGGCAVRELPVVVAARPFSSSLLRTLPELTAAEPDAAGGANFLFTRRTPSKMDATIGSSNPLAVEILKKTLFTPVQGSFFFQRTASAKKEIQAQKGAGGVSGFRQEPRKAQAVSLV